MKLLSVALLSFGLVIPMISQAQISSAADLVCSRKNSNGDTIAKAEVYLFKPGPVKRNASGELDINASVKRSGIQVVLNGVDYENGTLLEQYTSTFNPRTSLSNTDGLRTVTTEVKMMYYGLQKPSDHKENLEVEFRLNRDGTSVQSYVVRVTTSFTDDFSTEYTGTSCRARAGLGLRR